ncbi:hypothetical protein [Azohydromonas australica]|uniref:hypothetical protein n=1 Tax=Azohydromonas australica TaxID=364039 RepID=UPI00042A4D4C|nr:hypothetical protein [Azohydromonas australica]
MNILNSHLNSRLALVGSLFSMSVMLAACGGGQDEAYRAVNGEISQSLSSTDSAVVADGQDAAVLAADEQDNTVSAPPAAWELEDDPVVSETFLASQQARAAASATERAMAVATTDTRVKWNPGHYIALPQRDEPTIQKVMAEIKPLPQVKGLILRYEWAQLEKSKGVYDFSRLDRDLALVQAAGKRLWIMVGTKVFRPGGQAVPDYLRTAEYEGGAYKIVIAGRDAIGSQERYGENAALHNVKVRDRLIALGDAMGAHLNKHNALEGITFNETAMGQMKVPLTKAQQTAYFDNLAQVGAATQRAFPNTVVMQFINFPRAYMPGLISNMVSNKVALGGPDILIEDADLNTHIYPMYDPAKGKVAVGPSVQPENFATTVQHGAYNPPKISDLYNFGRTRLSANYMFWTRVTAGSPSPYTRTLDFFKSSAFPKDAAGGLISTCPSTYPSCVAKL